MDITPLVEGLRQDLAQTAAAMGPDMEEAADRLSLAVASSTRLMVMEALSEAAAEITTLLDGWSVEVRLRGREPVFAVAGSGPSPTNGDHTSPIPIDDTTLMSQSDQNDETARITLRIPEALKVRAEEQAAGRGQSLNTWLVNAARAAMAIPAGRDRTDTTTLGPGAPGGNRASNKRVQGWVR